MSDAFTALTVYDNFKQFFEQNPDRIYRYWVYRRMFTPYEQKQAYMDESFFEQSQALFGVVREVVPLPNGDLFLGIAAIAEDASELSADNRQMTYHHFSRMYVTEKWFESENELLEDLKNYDGSIELRGWLDELFGDG